MAEPGNNNEGVSSGGGSLTLIVALAAGGACALCLCVIAVVVLLRQKEGERTPTIGVETEQAPPKPARTSQVVPQYASPRDTMLSASTGSAFDSSLEEPPAQCNVVHVGVRACALYLFRFLFLCLQMVNCN